MELPVSMCFSSGKERFLAAGITFHPCLQKAMCLNCCMRSFSNFICLMFPDGIYRKRLFLTTRLKTKLTFLKCLARLPELKSGLPAGYAANAPGIASLQRPTRKQHWAVNWHIKRRLSKDSDNYRKYSDSVRQSSEWNALISLIPKVRLLLPLVSYSTGKAPEIVNIAYIILKVSPRGMITLQWSRHYFADLINNRMRKKSQTYCLLMVVWDN